MKRLSPQPASPPKRLCLTLEISKRGTVGANGGGPIRGAAHSSGAAAGAQTVTARDTAARGRPATGRALGKFSICDYLELIFLVWELEGGGQVGGGRGTGG